MIVVACIACAFVIIGLLGWQWAFTLHNVPGSIVLMSAIAATGIGFLLFAVAFGMLLQTRLQGISP